MDVFVGGKGIGVEVPVGGGGSVGNVMGVSDGTGG